MQNDEWEELAGFIFQSPVRSKRPPRAQNSGNFKRQTLERLIRVARGTPEVMVKVTGIGRGLRGIKEHLAYITRNGKLVAETGRGQLLESSRNVREVAEQWWSERGEARRRDARYTMNLMLSMPPGTNREAVAEATRAFARDTFGGRFDYVLAIHDDTNHPHAHIAVNALGLQDQRLCHNRADLQAWREHFAEVLRAHGVEAEATPRRTRGVVRKSVRQAVKHIEARGKSKVSFWKVEHAYAVARGAVEDPQPWQRVLTDRQRKIRWAWATLARMFDAHGHVALALRVKQFLDGMPTVVTEREEMLARAREALNQRSRGGRDR